MKFNLFVIAHYNVKISDHDPVNIYSCFDACKISCNRSSHVLKLESDYDFIPMFVQQTLLIGQMRNLIMTAEEREEGEREKEKGN